MTTPDQPTDPYRPEPDPSTPSTGGVPEYGQYSSGSEPYGAAGQPPAYPGYGQQGAYGQAGGFGQPGGYAGPPPQNYLVFSILTTVLCCLPLGIASIVFSAQVNSKWNAGDQAGAVESARKAKQFAIWSAAVGVVGTALYAILMFAGVLGGSFSSTTY